MKITADVEKRLIEYLETELRLATKDVVEPRQARHRKFDDAYYGVVKPRRKKWMSNIPMLMSATFTDSIKARLMGNIISQTPVFMLRPTRNSGWQEVVKQTEKFLDYKVQKEMKLPRALRKVLFEACRLGTGALFTPWRTYKEKKSVKKYFWNKNVEIDRSGLAPEYMPMRDLTYPAGFSDVEELPWWSRNIRWTELMLRKAKFANRYDYVDEVLKHETEVDDATQEAAARTGEHVGPRVRGYEFYFEWDLKGDGDTRRYVAVVNFDIRHVMSIEELNYAAYPLRLFRYGPRDYGLEGLGVIETTQPLDDGLYALYNLLIDNYKVSTMQCLKGKKGQGLAADTDVYPGKLFLLNDPADLEAFSLGQPYAVNAAFVKEVWGLGERRAGVSDYSLGRESPAVGRGATATGTMALIQEGQRRFDDSVADMRDTLDDFALFALDEIQERLDANQAYMLLGEKGRDVEAFLNLPNQTPSQGLSVVATASRASYNKETRKQDALATFQILERYYNTVQNLMIMLSQAPPEMQAVILKIAKGTSEKVKSVLEAHGDIAPDEYVDLLGGEDEQRRPGGVPPESGMAGSEENTPGAEGVPPGQPPGAGPPGGD